MANGKVKWYNEVKGYGFIETDNGTDIFVHRNNLSNPQSGLESDQKVVYETQKGERGLFAVNVKSAN